MKKIASIEVYETGGEDANFKFKAEATVPAGQVEIVVSGWGNNPSRAVDSVFVKLENSPLINKDKAPCCEVKA